MDVLHDVGATRLEVGQEWCGITDALKIVNRQVDADTLGHGE